MVTISFYKCNSDNSNIYAECDDSDFITSWVTCHDCKGINCEVPRQGDYVELEGKLYLVKQIVWRKAGFEQLIVCFVV